MSFNNKPLVLRTTEDFSLTIRADKIEAIMQTENGCIILTSSDSYKVTNDYYDTCEKVFSNE